MKYLTTTEVAEKWNISDRRVRVLCKEGRIPGIKEENGSYMTIPFDAVKPKDKRFRTQPKLYIYRSGAKPYKRRTQCIYGCQSNTVYEMAG